MKRIFTTTALALGLLLSTPAGAQKEGNDMFIPIAKYITSGNAEALSAWFADNLEIGVVSNESAASRNQARQIVKVFFETYTPSSFSITHTAGRADMKYAVGELSAGGESFHVTIFVKCKDGDNRIQEFKIEKN